MWALFKGSHLTVEYDGETIYEDDDIETFEKLGDKAFVIQRNTHITLLTPFSAFDLQNTIYWKIYHKHLFVVRDTKGLITCAIYNCELEQTGSWQYIGDMWCVVYGKVKSWFAPFYVTGWNPDYTTGVVKNMPNKISTVNPTTLIKIKEKQLLYNLDEIFEDDFVGL